MTVALLLYSLAVSLVLGAMALLVERVLLRWDVSTRGVWACVLLVSAGTPVAALLLGADHLRALAESSQWLSVHLLLPVDEVQRVTTRLQFLADYLLPDLARLLGGLWVAAGIGVLLWLLVSWHRLRSRSRSWVDGEVRGVSCMVSRDTGPGLVGFFRTRLVVPWWVLDLDESRQAMIVAHEEEHHRRRDPWLMSVGYGALLLAPWNPVLWWQVRRLRLAVEMDCDHRVLDRVGNVPDYGRLLLDLAEKGPELVTAFSHTESHLVRRIRRIDGQLRPGPTRAAVTGIGALVAATLLWALPLPVSPPSPPGEVSTITEVRRNPTPFEEPPRCLNCEELGISTSGPDAGLPPPPTGQDAAFMAVYVSEEGRAEGGFCVGGCDGQLREPPFPRLERLRYAPARIWGISVPTWGVVEISRTDPPGAGRPDDRSS